ncbi:MAG: helix-turn-helix domain-containing protein [Flavobacteriaceae bacterium]
MLEKGKKLSQEKLAYKIEIDRKYASLIEKGKTNLSVEYLKKICDGLEIKLSDFFRNIDE